MPDLRPARYGPRGGQGDTAPARAPRPRRPTGQDATRGADPAFHPGAEVQTAAPRDPGQVSPGNGAPGSPAGPTSGSPWPTDSSGPRSGGPAAPRGLRWGRLVRVRSLSLP